MERDVGIVEGEEGGLVRGGPRLAWMEVWMSAERNVTKEGKRPPSQENWALGLDSPLLGISQRRYVGDGGVLPDVVEQNGSLYVR